MTHRGTINRRERAIVPSDNSYLTYRQRYAACITCLIFYGKFSGHHRTRRCLVYFRTTSAVPFGDFHRESPDRSRHVFSIASRLRQTWRIVRRRLRRFAARSSRDSTSRGINRFARSRSVFPCRETPRVKSELATLAAVRDPSPVRSDDKVPRWNRRAPSNRRQRREDAGI